jgi:hypothetical protein
MLESAMQVSDAGHDPLEDPGLAQMEEAIADFITEVIRS